MTRRKLTAFPSMVRIAQGSWVEMAVKLEPRKGPSVLFMNNQRQGIFQEPLPSGDTLPFSMVSLVNRTGSGSPLFPRAISLKMPLLATMIAGYHRNIALSGPDC